MGSLWEKLLDPKTLERGWHLARLDTKSDFAEDLFSTDTFGHGLGFRIQELSSRIKTESYQPRPLFRLEVPKGSLGFRPGSIIPIQDRVVVSSIILLIAEILDSRLPDSVYSWRLKRPIPKKGSIFEDSDIGKFPFLKKTTIRYKFDPFLPWYNIWPKFDQEARQAYIKEGYRYLAVSDIAAYFENIQLPILRDLLLQHFPNEHHLLNLLFSFLETWTQKTADGRVHLRGIPQGNFVSSFLGNIFLLPLDLKFQNFEKSNGARYFRYMDDVRIFTKHIEDARLAVFTMDRELRRLHLNVQTAKTKILDHKAGEITRTLVDDRVDEISKLIDEIEGHNKNGTLNVNRKFRYLKRLNDIAKKEVKGRQKLLGSKPPLRGLSVRAFSRWIYAHTRLGSSKYIDRLLKEIESNPDFKLTKKLVNTTRLFPNKRKIESRIYAYLNSNKNIFPHQEAECLRALRYIGNLHKPIIERAITHIRNMQGDQYVRMQSAYLLSRTNISNSLLSEFEKIFEIENSSYVQVALSAVIVQRRSNNGELIRKLVFHPNEKVGDIGKLYRSVKLEDNLAANRLEHMFRPETPWLLCDNMLFVHLMSVSNNDKIRKRLLTKLREPRLKHPVFGLRPILKDVFTRTRESLRNGS